jgi:hypothetical protein
MNTKARSNPGFQRLWIRAITFALVAVVCAILGFRARAQNPSSGTVSPSPGGLSAAWDQTVITPGGGVNTEAACVDGVNCEVFTLTVASPASSWAGQKVRVQLTWQSSGNEYDIWIHKGGSVNGQLVTSAMAGPGLTSQTAYIDPATAGTGTFTIHIVPDTTPVVTDHYHGTATAVPLIPPPPAPAPQDSGPKIGYENFAAPGVLVPVKTTEAGQQVNSVEYMGRNAGEPSIGSNWATGVAMFKSGLEALFVTFDDSCPASGIAATWVNRAAPTSVGIDSDPIGFTDRGFTDLSGFHSRTFVGELTLLSPDTVKLSYTDSDGVPTPTAPTGWTPDQTGGLASAVDHETIGAGPYRTDLTAFPPVIAPVHSTYPNAVYYCSQDIAFASCSRSDDGGLTYGGSVPIYNLTTCGGLHGHVKVTPETPQTLPAPSGNGSAGIVYVPNPNCGDMQAVVVSQDNGITWSIRPTPINNPGGSGVGSDPAVGIDSNGRVYFVGAANGTAAAVATSDDRGLTWQNVFDVSATYGLKNIAFPAAVAGSATAGNPNSGRAAVAFYGSTTATGDSNAANFPGVWHLYAAHTFDGGSTWTTTDVTPNAPMQRAGLLRGGGADITRNLLDFFDITIDNEGRVLIGYVDGCEGGNCKQAAPTATGNAYTTTATIARQSSGRRMLAANDPPSPLTAASKPGMPSVTQRRVGQVVHLAWSEADTGNSNITGYQILRGTASGAEGPLITVPGTQTGGTYDDLSASDITKTYYYKVLAVNGFGPSCGNNEIAAPYVGDTCSGITIHKNDSTHPEANAGTATPSLLIDYIAVGEPPSSPGNFMFKMKVNDLSTVPPNSRWRITWDSASSPGQQYYVGMTTGPSGPPTFEYGTLADAGVPAVFVIQETKVASALPASNFTADGTITIFAPKSAFGNPQPGDLLGAVGGRTITGDTSDCSADLPPCTPNSQLERSNAFVDHTFVKAQSDNSYPAATYTVVGNVSCATPTPTQCLEDDDPHIVYDNGWHTISDTNATAGHFHLDTGKDVQHALTFTFNLQSDTGSLQYRYATSSKGGTAQVLIDGHAPTPGAINYQASTGTAGSGSMHDPFFKDPTGQPFSITYSITGKGTHKLELVNLTGPAYVDEFCITNGGSSTMATSGPGTTTTSTSALAIGQSLLQNVMVPSNALGFSVAAEANVNVPYTLVVIDPTGKVLGTVNSSSNGIASVSMPVSTSGLYVIQLVNVGVGPVNIWTAATPLVRW